MRDKNKILFVVLPHSKPLFLLPPPRVYTLDPLPLNYIEGVKGKEKKEKEKR